MEHLKFSCSVYNSQYKRLKILLQWSELSVTNFTHVFHCIICRTTDHTVFFSWNWPAKNCILQISTQLRARKRSVAINPVVLSECKGTDSMICSHSRQLRVGRGVGKLPFCEILMAVFMKMQIFQHDTVSTGKQLWELRKSIPPSSS